MMTYNEMVLARQRYEDVNKIKGRAEIEPATVTINVLDNAINTLKAAFAPKARKAQTTRVAVRRKLATE